MQYCFYICGKFHRVKHYFLDICGRKVFHAYVVPLVVANVFITYTYTLYGRKLLQYVTNQFRSHNVVATLVGSLKYVCICVYFIFLFIVRSYVKTCI